MGTSGTEVLFQVFSPMPERMTILLFPCFSSKDHLQVLKHFLKALLPPLLRKGPYFTSLRATNHPFAWEWGNSWTRNCIAKIWKVFGKLGLPGNPTFIHFPRAAFGRPNKAHQESCQKFSSTIISIILEDLYLFSAFSNNFFVQEITDLRSVSILHGSPYFQLSFGLIYSFGILPASL